MISTLFFKKKNKDNSQNITPATSISLNTTGSSEHLNPEEGHCSSTKNDEPPLRLVPGGQMPKDQGKKMLRHLAGLLIMMVVQVGIPLALYYGLRNQIGVVYALVISGIPPFLWVIFEFIRKRRVDALGVIIALSFILSGVISIVSGDARAALIRDGAVGAVIGGFFLITLIPINTSWLVLRPLTHIIGEQMFAGIQYQWTDRDGNERTQSIVEWQFENIRFFRWSMRLQTLAWGVLLILELVACVLFVEITDMSTDDIVKYNNIINGVVIGVMVTVSTTAGWYARKLVKEVGKKWTEENDFTDKFQGQQQTQQHQELEQNKHQSDDGYGYDNIHVGNIV